jgi:hypothetical protein
MQTFSFDENLDDWCNWALGNGIAIEMVQFLRFRPNMLSDFDPNRLINPTPRSWAMANEVDNSLPSDLYFANIAGLVGESAAAEYTGFKRIYDLLPDISEIISTPETSLVPEDPPVLYALVGALAYQSTVEVFEKLRPFIDRIPPEFQVMYLLDAIKREPKIKESKYFVSWAVKNAELLS